MPKLAVITGGAGGMGLAVARLLGRDGAVLISDVTQDRLDVARADLAEAGIDCVTAVCDVTDAESVRRLADLAQRSGTVTSVVHTAGLSPSMSQAETIMRVNAVGTVLINRAFLDVATADMAVVNVASIAGHQLPGMLAPTRRYKRAFSDVDRLQADLVAVCNLAPQSLRAKAAYAVSKNFVIWYSRVAAARFGAKGARVLSVSPGSFDTPMGQLEDAEGARAMAEVGALKRFGKTSEIAALLAFCAGEEAGYLTGTDIVCDGGVMAGLTLPKMLKVALG